MSDTEAPTSGVTEAALAKKTSGSPGLNSKQLDFVMLQSQFYGIEGRLMNVTEAVNEYYFEEAEFLKLVTNKKVLAALEEQGVALKRKQFEVEPYETPEDADKDSGAVVPTAEEPSWRDSALTPLQLITANTMLDLVDTRSQKKKLQDLGVSTTLYNTWLKNPVFHGYLQKRAEAMLGENQHEALLALLDKVRMGDMKAIAYYNEMTGRFVPERASSGAVGSGTTSQIDFKNMLIRVLEIINDEVDGPTALRISEKIQGLVGATAMVNTMAESIEGEIVVPEVAETRTLTPRLQALMEAGEGNN